MKHVKQAVSACEYNECRKPCSRVTAHIDNMFGPSYDELTHDDDAVCNIF